MNSIAPKLQKCWTHKIAFKTTSKMQKQLNFFYSQPSALPEDAPAKFYLSMKFGLRFMINSVAPARSSTSYFLMEQCLATFFVQILSLRKIKSSSLDMIYIINAFDFQETNSFCSLKINYKPKVENWRKQYRTTNCLR